jgi:kynureninase
MQGMTYTKRDAQEAMQKLMQGNVVLVGHALHHDLHALQLDPTAVIDTALLCSYKYANSCPDLCSMWHAASCAVLHFLPASHTF